MGSSQRKDSCRRKTVTLAVWWGPARAINCPGSGSPTFRLAGNLGRPCADLAQKRVTRFFSQPWSAVIGPSPQSFQVPSFSPSTLRKGKLLEMPKYFPSGCHFLPYFLLLLDRAPFMFSLAGVPAYTLPGTSTTIIIHLHLPGNHFSSHLVPPSPAATAIMLPLGFNDLAASPTIVMSPHQHQFDPISSRAAHSIYYHQHQKPLMPTRTWDHPSKALASSSFSVSASLLRYPRCATDRGTSGVPRARVLLPLHSVFLHRCLVSQDVVPGKAFKHIFELLPPNVRFK